MKNTSSRSSRGWLSWVAALALSAAGSVHAGPIYGGPTYDSTTGNGYFQGSVTGVADNGTAVGEAAKNESTIYEGVRVVRWDASGAPPTELGNLSTDAKGFGVSYAFAINSAGTTVGYSSTYKGIRAVRWDASGTTPTELGTLGTDANGYSLSEARAVNATGTAVGYATKFESGFDKGYRAVRWDASGTAATELGNLGANANGVTYNQPNAINAAGTAVGWADKYESGIYKGLRAVRWDATGAAATELGNLGTDASGHTSGEPLAINTAGTAVGYAPKYESGDFKGLRAVRWDASGTAATELGGLGTDSNGFTYSEAFAINPVGTTVGAAKKYDAGFDTGNRAVRWDASGTTATELGNLGGNAWCSATAVNAAGTAVGSVASDWYYFTVVDRTILVLVDQRAVAWGLDGLALDLNTLIDPGSGWVNLYEARAISDTGWIAGYGNFDPDGQGGIDAYPRMFLLQVPEPAGLLLIVFTSSLSLYHRRKRS